MKKKTIFQYHPTGILIALFPFYWNKLRRWTIITYGKTNIKSNFFLIRFIHLLTNNNMIVFLFFCFFFVSASSIPRRALHENKPYFCYQGNPYCNPFVHTFIRMYRVTKQPLEGKKIMIIIIIMQEPMVHQHRHY